MPNDQDILSANLAKLGLTEPELAERLSEAQPALLQWSASRAGPMTATIEHRDRPLWLASRYDPFAEADKLASMVDHAKHACVVTLGLGLGYHVAQIASQIGDTQTLMIVYEPDLAMMRAVLERIDHTAWLGRANIILADDQMDRAAMLRRVEKCSGMLTLGTVLVTNPPSRQLHNQALNDFGRLVAEVLGFCRTNVATALVNATRTYRNLSINLPHYAAGADVNDLAGAAAGFPAVCIGAGPSLSRNIELLIDPKVRANVVVIAAQTMLKPLLAYGIKPDFVTALDYHEISKRFYEGLTELPDVTLVAEPLVHPMVLESFPGPIRVTNSNFLDVLLGDQARQRVTMPSGATVSHLSFYLAQHLGCDPIILIGMDLGFSDGLYYFPGTAIHDVWAPELGPFNTLEMMEWRRIVRHRNHLQKLDDIRGRPIYSDEQMLTYLKQFERDFSVAPQTVLDATEGGLPKQHTTRITLADALAKHATRPVPALPIPRGPLDADRLVATARLLRHRRDEVMELRRLSRNTIPLLRQMLESQEDSTRMTKLFKKLEPIQRRVEELNDAFGLINSLNTVGAFKRARSDRSIDHAEVDETERQRQRLERDKINMDWLIQACDEALDIFRDAIERVEQCRRALSPVKAASRKHTKAALQTSP